VPEKLAEGFADLQATTLLYGDFTVALSTVVGAAALSFGLAPLLSAVAAVYVGVATGIIFLIARMTKERSFQSAVAEQELEDNLDELLDLPEIARTVGRKELLGARFGRRIEAVYGTYGTQVRAGNSQVILTATMRLLGVGLIPFVFWAVNLYMDNGLDNPTSNEPHGARDTVLALTSMFLLTYHGMKLAPMLQSMTIGGIAANTIVELVKNEADFDAPVVQLTLSRGISIPLSDGSNVDIPASSISQLKGSSVMIR
jgi:ABC-type multidrug transport system fused ATPase/permease subunit